MSCAPGKTLSSVVSSSIVRLAAPREGLGCCIACGWPGVGKPTVTDVPEVDGEGGMIPVARLVFMGEATAACSG